MPILSPSDPTSLPPVRGYALLNHPWYNKDHAFNKNERNLLGLTGLLPATHVHIDEQVALELKRVREKSSDLERYIGLVALQDRNETLFYRLLVEHISELLPIVYTPTVGLACENYSQIARRARGLWITPDDQNHIAQVLRNAPQTETKLIVVTDNERILGLGDQGCGGMGIAVGKLALYTAAAGIHPAYTLPISLDVGTNNQKLLEDPQYLGYRAPRLRGTAYRTFIEAFINAVNEVFPHVLLQWEDFHRDTAAENLVRYRQRLTSFNDDIQGTASVALAGIIAANRYTQRNWEDTRILFVGAGSAGKGVGDLVRLAMEQKGISAETIRRNLVFMDSRGLLIEGRADLPEIGQELLVMPSDLAQHLGLSANDDLTNLAHIIDKVQPTVLLGTAAQAQIFTESAIRSMAKSCPRPLIMPFSNPTTKAECTAAQAVEWTEGRALVATGSPFAPVDYQGRRLVIGQGNNVFIFPGVGLGCIVAQARSVTDEMFLVAAATLADCVGPGRLAQGAVYPEPEQLRDVSLKIAAAVVRVAGQRHLGKQIPDVAVEESIMQTMWFPEYPLYA